MILKYLKGKEWGIIVACVVLIGLQVYLDLEIPGYMSAITNIISTHGTSDMVMAEGWGMIACALGSLVSSIIVGYMATWVATSLSKRLRELQFDKVESFSMEEINKFSTASLITRSTNDITQIQTALAMGLQITIKAPILAVWAIIKISGKSWQWTAATSVAVFVLILIIGLLMFFVTSRYKKIQWLTDNLNRTTRENLTGIRVIRAYNAEGYQENRFDQANEDLTANNLFTTRAMSVMMPSMTTIMSLLSLSVYWIGAILISSAGTASQLTLFSDMVVFSAYAMQIVMAFMMLIILFMILPRATVAARRVEEVINTESTILDGTVTTAPNNEVGEISFKNVGFKYPGASDYVLKDVSFDVHKGETVAFIGSTGSGKSTLVNLVPRFYDVTEGQITIDGVDIREYTQDALHSKMGYVPQKAVIFAGTVSSNVTYGSKFDTEEDIRKAISIAQSTDFVEKMEGKYNSLISQGGTNVSGGQKQRISIARAVCRRPEIYIFDDSFSALDYKTDHMLRNALKKETGGTTSLIVAQRIGTIMDADKIVVIDEGRIVGIGKHKELLKTCPVYYEIASSQLSEEELSV
ncbi:MAG: ABC transporter ATP-binding protein [Candidatus Methanomethylophilaceae archaeon]|nr:ABC transporter ATP-binding protein/permease [Candidatus Methanomethylophilaceae archaeon]MDD3378951.1 ABC transporter ATP-binding protein [Candidatus Methanomethylophilaceae archaeon]MDY0224229.1 ABC transporter ATP-binding protein [Candidatus Methanomethylophilaceae archaeon]